MSDIILVRPDWPAPDNVVAFTTTRTGGHSRAPYAGFNLADHVGDDRDAVVANRAALSRLLPVNSAVHWLTQVHGVEVLGVPHTVTQSACADASFSRTPGDACAVLTADCLPVLFCSRAGDVVAAAHAGWRGLLGGVLENTVAAMGVDPGQLLAWLGPAIGPALFEVGPEVRAAFLAAAGPAHLAQTDACFVPSSSTAGHYMANLYALARLRLAALDSGSIYGGEFCTVTEKDRFFSYRRDGRTGRMASLILIKSP